MTKRSMPVPALAAATIPRNTAMMTATPIVVTASEMVGSARCAISVVTGSPQNIELPRLPWARLAIHTRNCFQIGSVGQNLLGDFAKFSGVAVLPPQVAAGAPPAGRGYLEK